MNIILKYITILCIFFVLIVPIEVQSICKVSDIRHGRLSEYSRIVLEIDKSIPEGLTRHYIDNIIEFKIPDSVVISEKTGKLNDPLLEKIWWEKNDEEDLLIKLKTKISEVDVRHFFLQNPPRIVIDVKRRDSEDNRDISKKDKKDKTRHLTKIYSFVETFEPDEDSEKKIKAEKPKTETEMIVEKEMDEAEEEYKIAVDYFKKGALPKAVDKFSLIIRNFPESKYVEPSYFFIGDCYYYMAEQNPNIKHLLAIQGYKDAIRTFPESKFVVKALYHLGNCYLRMKYFYEAESVYQQVIDEYSKSRYAPLAQLGKGKNLYQYDRFIEAIIEFQKVVDKYRDTKVAWEASYRIADSYFKNKEFKRAKNYYEHSKNIWPSYLNTHIQTFFNMGENYYQNKDYDKAILTFFEVANLKTKKEISQRAFARIGDSFREKGMTKEALRVYSEVITDYEEGEGFVLSKIRMADIGAEGKIMDKEQFVFNDHPVFNYLPCINPIKTYGEIYDEFPSSGFADLAIFKEGNMLKKNKKFREATEKFKVLLRQYPESILFDDTLLVLESSIKELINFYYKQGRHYSAIEIYTDNLEPYLLKMEDPKTLFLIGNSYNTLGLRESALVTFSNALKISHKNKIKDLILFEIGKLYSQYGDKSKSEKTFRFLLKQYPHSRYSVDSMHYLADILYEKGNFKDASILYLSAIRKDKHRKRNAISYHMLGNCYKELGKYSKAINTYKVSRLEFKKMKYKKEEISDYIRDQYFNLAEALLFNQEYKKALSTFQKATSLYPKDKRAGWALYTIGSLLMKIKKEENALKTWESVKKKYPDNIWAQMADESIRGYHFEKRYRSYFKRG
ncbi:MAG TPA: tetratricopeptide repeat protein [Nitrospinota bacterium]|nr:tetratricopeptide repeat protein [Nitrospinota bacterium]